MTMANQYLGLCSADIICRHLVNSVHHTHQFCWYNITFLHSDITCTYCKLQWWSYLCIQHTYRWHHHVCSLVPLDDLFQIVYSNDDIMLYTCISKCMQMFALCVRLSVYVESISTLHWFKKPGTRRRAKPQTVVIISRKLAIWAVPVSELDISTDVWMLYIE